MKIAWFCIPAHGHTNPTLGLVKALTEAGHQVWYFSFEEFREKIEGAGATFIGCDGYDFEMEDKGNADRVGKDKVYATELLVSSTLALDEMTARMIDEIKPDIVVSDSVAFWGKLAAMKHGLPYVSSTTTFAFNRYSAKYMQESVWDIARMLIAMPRINKQIKRLREKGYPVKSILDIVQNDNDTNTIVYTSRYFQPCSETFSDKYHFIGPSIRPITKPVEKTAVGPTGTSITKLLGEKLDPPTEKDKKSLPVPGEGEAFSAVLHPAYLKKADINTFSVDRSSDDFKELFKSIERFGVKDPVLARFNKDGDLEILSGQRRHLIASELNYPVPTIIQQLDDDDARILVADGNLHREHISTYDLSRALRMKADSMKRKAGRKLRGVKGGPETDELIAKEMGMSTMKLNRLMKLSEATQQICDLVDDGTIAVSIAYNIAFLQPKHQDMVADMIGINVKVNNENTTNLKKIAARYPRYTFCRHFCVT